MSCRHVHSRKNAAGAGWQVYEKKEPPRLDEIMFVAEADRRKRVDTKGRIEPTSSWPVKLN
jgi:hypothetical protein